MIPEKIVTQIHRLFAKGSRAQAVAAVRRWNLAGEIVPPGRVVVKCPVCRVRIYLPCVPCQLRVIREHKPVRA